MVRDLATGECFRADHLLEDVMGDRLAVATLDAALRTECALLFLSFCDAFVIIQKN